MNQKVLKTIEYTKIIALLKEEAGSALGKEKAESLLLPVGRKWRRRFWKRRMRRAEFG